MTRGGEEYRGDAYRDARGGYCKPWDSEHDNVAAQDGQEANFWAEGELRGKCRNPDDSEQPWCYKPTGGWEYCRIPMCEGT